MNKTQFYAGLMLAVLAALIILLGKTEMSMGISIAIGMLGIGLIATSRRR